jgi:hypothetical protein
MNHLTEEELVERYYAASAAGPADGAEEATDAHLNECEVCSAALAAIESDLAVMRAVRIPEREANYGEQMWARVEAGLPPCDARRTSVGARLRRFTWFRGVSYAAGCAVLVLGAFYLGRVWEQRHTGQAVAHSAPQASPAPQPKVVVVVLGDHLDRSERLLVELKHADRSTDPEDLEPLKDEARSLLAANHVFREDAEGDDDRALSETLSHLDKVLAEIASQPDGLDAAEAARIRDEMNAEGLLFEVRVLRSKNPHRTKAVRVIAKGGAA